MKKSVAGKTSNDFLPLEKIERVCFEKIELNLAQIYRIPKCHLKGWKLTVKDMESFGPVSELMFVLRNFILHGKEEKTDWQDFPATWFDHFKLHLNISYGFKLKVRMSKFARKIVNMRVCPHISTDNRTHFEYLQFKDVPLYGFGEYDEKI